MGEKNTEKKEIVEIRGDRVEATPDDEKTIELSRTYKFENEEVSSLYLSGLEEITAADMIKANNIMTNDGAAAVIPENTMYFALILASFATGMPVEFFKELRPNDAIRVKRFITQYFFVED